MNLAEYYRKHPKRSWMFVVVFALLIASIAIAMVIQSHNERVLEAELTESESELKSIGAQIASIKDRDLGSLAGYVQAYARIEPLTRVYDQSLQRYSDLYRVAEWRDQNRGLLYAVRHPHTRHQPEAWRNGWEIVDLVQQVNEITKKEVSVIHDMSSLPENEQVQFWHEEFMPLAAQEHALREQLRIVGQRSSSQSSEQ
jgi:hypothetical protein